MCFSRIPWFRGYLGVVLLLMLIISGCDSAMKDGPTPVDLRTPDRFPLMTFPADNPLTEEGIALGERLFFDPLLSINGEVSCASCHEPRHAFSDPRPVSIGAEGRRGRRNAMPIFNLGWAPSLFWDGRSPSLEEQAIHPVENITEMGEDWPRVLEKLQNHPTYPGLFEAAFETETITRDQVTKALAQFERTLISSNARIDDFLNGEGNLTAVEQRGFDLFFSERGDCFHCHGTRLFTDNLFHNNGLEAVPSDSGRALITGNPAHAGMFRTPSLRNVEFTAPYMHDGRFATLEAVIEHYSTGVQATNNLDPLLNHGQRGNFTAEEKEGLVAFLKTLSDPAFAQPR